MVKCNAYDDNNSICKLCIANELEEMRRCYKAKEPLEKIKLKNHASVLTEEALFRYDNVVEYVIDIETEILRISTLEGTKIFNLSDVIQTTLSHYPRNEVDRSES